MEVKNSLDWDTVRYELTKEINGVCGEAAQYRDRTQARTLLFNIDKSVNMLSNAELALRKRPPGSNDASVVKACEKVNKEIEELSQWLLILRLSR